MRSEPEGVTGSALSGSEPPALSRRVTRHGWGRSVLVVGTLAHFGPNGSMGQRMRSPESPRWGRQIGGTQGAFGRNVIDTMDTERKPTADEWRTKAMVELERVTSAERRFSQSITLNNEVTMLAAADELQAATSDATVWRMANPCPDAKLGTHVTWMLTTCMEVAITAQRALTDRSADIDEAMGRLGLLLAVIDFHSQTLDAW